MKTYLVSYDLNRPRGEADYANLIAAIRQDGGVKVLYSQWLVRSERTSMQLAQRYLTHMDANDRLLVCIPQDASWYNLMSPGVTKPMLDAA